VENGAIKNTKDKDIQKWKGFVILGFHGELDMRGNVVKMVKERD
jgi:hypothetical protein